MKFDNKNGIYEKDAKATLKIISTKIDQCAKKIKSDLKVVSSSENRYNTDYASLNLISDRSMLDIVKKTAQDHIGKKVVVIGIGGSNLGTQAIVEAMYGKYQDKILFADTVDEITIQNIIDKISSDKSQYVINLVSKSGNTTESIANYLILISAFGDFLGNKISVVITTDRDSPLWEYGKTNSYDLLPIPAKVGGRYSVFSSVGLFPLYVAGINVDKLLQGAKSAIDNNLKSGSISQKSATQIYYQYKKGKSILETFVFSPILESYGKWNRQLVAESLGKENNLAGTCVNAGITPTVAVGSTDLHSMAQLYLGGPKDKNFNFIIPEKSFAEKLKFSVSSKKLLVEFDPNLKVLQYLKNKSLNQVMSAIIIGTQESFVKRNIPYTTYNIRLKDEYDIAYLMQTKMIETMYLGALMEINSFDQPNVEEYKNITRKLLDK